jgi:poly-gamma-glutamate synthesis protein (capsule biosynthesis protein)
MKIIIAGDLFIADDFRSQDLIDKSVIDLFETADYRIVNLEAPINEDNPKNKIIKTGPHLRMSSNTIMPYLHQLKIDAVTLANNHILDYGTKGLTDTFETLKRNKIDFVGAGNTLNEATQPLTLEKDGMRIAILNFCENEWSIAEADKPGANPMDIIDNTNQIKAAKSTHDKVICIIHGGHEYFHLPSPRMQKQYRFYVDNGADAIVGHHTHCIGGYEIYNDVPIIYSLGNFLFSKSNNNPEWYKGLVVILNIINNEPIGFKIKHVKTNNETFQIAVKQDPGIFTFIDKLNGIISKTDMLNNEWESYGKIKADAIIKRLSPLALIKNKYLSYLFRKFVFEGFYNDKQFIKIIQNQFRCEAHYELTKNALKKIYN